MAIPLRPNGTKQQEGTKCLLKKTIPAPSKAEEKQHHGFSWCKRPRIQLGILRQIAASLLLSLTGIYCGMTCTYTAVAAPSWKSDPDTPFNLTHHEIGLHASIVSLGALLGSLSAGPLITWAGPKWVIFSSEVVYMLSWVMVTLPTSKLILFSGRFLAGVTVDIVLFAAMIYSNDLVSAKLRRRLTPVPMIMFNVGSILTYAMGMVMDWKTLGIWNILLPLPLIICCVYLPDSPSYLLRNRSEETALKSLQWYREGSEEEEIQKELEDLKTEHLHDKQQEQRRRGCVTWISKEFWKPLLISLAVVILRIWSGANTIIAFTVDIFSSTESSVNPHVASIVVASVLLSSQLLSSGLAGRLGRRRFLLASTILCGLSQIVFGFYYYFRHSPGYEEIAVQLGMLPLICLIVQRFAYGMGLHHLQYSVPLEILPPEIRTHGIAITQFSTSLSCFLMLNYFYDMTDSFLGFHGTFWIYGVSCLLLSILIVKQIPEIKNRKTKKTAFGATLALLPQGKPYTISNASATVSNESDSATVLFSPNRADVSDRDGHELIKKRKALFVTSPFHQFLKNPLHYTNPISIKENLEEIEKLAASKVKENFSSPADYDATEEQDSMEHVSASIPPPSSQLSEDLDVESGARRFSIEDLQSVVNFLEDLAPILRSSLCSLADCDDKEIKTYSLADSSGIPMSTATVEVEPLPRIPSDKDACGPFQTLADSSVPPADASLPQPLSLDPSSFFHTMTPLLFMPSTCSSTPQLSGFQSPKENRAALIAV